MNIEEEMINRAAEEMARSMDFDMLCDIFVAIGYVVVKVEYGDVRKWVDVMAWANENSVDEFQEHNGKWLFKNPKDATMFKLRWA